MAKAFKKAPPPPEVEEVEAEEVETETEQVIKAAAAAAAEVEEPTEVEEEVEVEPAKPAKGAAKANGEQKPKGAPRARKWNYGASVIGTKSQAKIFRLKDATAPKGVADQWDYAKTGTTIAAFYEAGGDRHGLRVMMRGKAIIVKDAAGNSYPQVYDHAAAEVERKERAERLAAARAAKEAKAAEEQEEAPAPVPAKPAVKKVVKAQAAK